MTALAPTGAISQCEPIGMACIAKPLMPTPAKAPNIERQRSARDRGGVSAARKWCAKAFRLVGALKFFMKVRTLVFMFLVCIRDPGRARHAVVTNR